MLSKIPKEIYKIKEILIKIPMMCLTELEKQH